MKLVRKGVICFHMINNNIPFNNQGPSCPVDAIDIVTENEFVYAKKGDPDELGKHLLDFLNSSVFDKNIDGFETFLYHKKVPLCECKVVCGKVQSRHKITYKYHVVVDTYLERITNVSVESVIDASKLHNIFPEFFQQLKELC